MAEPIHLWQETPARENGTVTVGVVMEQGAARKRLWYRVPEEHVAALTTACDPYVVALQFPAMLKRADLFVHGSVSPALLRNLEEFQNVWACWQPAKYAAVQIFADAEQETPRVSANAAISAFSTGVDAAYTVWCHRRALCGRRTQNLQAGILVHGSDIKLEHDAVYEFVLQRARAMLASVGMQVIPIATNLRQFDTGWLASNGVGAGIASCLMLFQAGWNTGLIASGSTYDHIHYNLGSSFLTDRFLSSGAFTVINDAAEIKRLDKVRALAQWEHARRNLRVCWQSDAYENCCHCRKCIRTILEFRAVGAGLPECFPRDINKRTILLQGSSAAELDFLEEVAAAIQSDNLSGGWTRAARLACYISRVRSAGKNLFARAV